MDELKKIYRVAQFIGIAMIGSLFIYIAIIEILKMNSGFFRRPEFPEMEMVRYIFFIIAIGVFFLIRWIRQILLFKRTSRELPDQGKVLASKIQRLMTTTIMTYALCESVAIFGLILFFMGGSPLDFYIFMIVSLFFFAIYFPRYRQWVGYISQKT